MKSKLKIKHTFVLASIILVIISTVYVSIGAENDVDEMMMESLIQNMADDNISVKVDAVKNLVDIGELAVEPLINATKNTNPDIRENSAYALGKIGDPKAVEPLIKLLEDNDSEVQYAASIALGNIGEPALESLVEFIGNPNKSYPARLTAIRVLGEMGEPAVQPLIGMLGSTEGVAAAASLGNIGEPAVSPLINILDDDDPKVRAYAARALGGTKDERAVEPLISLLEDKDANVRSNAAMALGQIGDERAVEALTKSLNDEDERVRSIARSSIEEIESQNNDGIIAIYGKERDFYIEDERRSWLDELALISNSARDDMQKYIRPNGSVISYGYSYDGYISVEFQSGSDVNTTLMDEIYGMFDEKAKKDGINDVPVVFQYGEIIITDNGDTDEAPSTPGFTSFSLLMILLLISKLK
jgi:HEAT repeat protein